VLAVGEDGRGNAVNLVIRQGRVGTKHRGAATERGSELHGVLHNKEVEGWRADRASRFRPLVGIGLVPVEPGVGSAAASLLSSRPCDPGLWSRGSGGNTGDGGCEASGLTGMSRRAASAIVEAVCGLYLDKSFRG